MDCTHEREGANIFAGLVRKHVLSVVPKPMLLTRTFGGLRGPVGFKPDEGKMPVDRLRLTRIYILRR